MGAVGSVFGGIGIIIFMLAVVYLCIEVAWGSFSVSVFNTKEVGKTGSTSLAQDVINNLGANDDKTKITTNVLSGITKFPIITGYSKSKISGVFSLSEEGKD